MVDAAKTALERLDRPATPREIYDAIVEARLFSFGAQDPVSVLSSTLRRHTEGSKTLRGEPLFVSRKRGQFELRR